MNLKVISKLVMEWFQILCISSPYHICSGRKFTNEMNLEKPLQSLKFID